MVLFTLIVTVSVSVPPLPSLTVNVTSLLVGAEKPGAQLKIFSESDEPDGLPETGYVSTSLSRSDPESVSDRVEPSATV